MIVCTDFHWIFLDFQLINPQRWKQYGLWQMKKKVCIYFFFSIYTLWLKVQCMDRHQIIFPMYLNIHYLVMLVSAHSMEAIFRYEYDWLYMIVICNTLSCLHALNSFMFITLKGNTGTNSSKLLLGIWSSVNHHTRYK